MLINNVSLLFLQIYSQPLPSGQCGSSFLQNSIFSNNLSPSLLNIGNNQFGSCNDNLVNSLNLAENNCANNLAFDNNLSNVAFGNFKFEPNNALNLLPSSLNSCQSNAVFTPMISEIFPNLQYGDINVNGDLPIGGTVKVRGSFPVYGIVQVDGSLPSVGTAIVNSECGYASQAVEPGCLCNNRIL